MYNHAGYSKDGGLYMPQVIPVIQEEEWNRFASLDFKQITYELCRKFISHDELSNECLKGEDKINN